MPTLSEFKLTILLRHDERSDITSTVFKFETVRKFKAFQYRIQVEDEFDKSEETIHFQIKGVRAPSGLMPSIGSAATEVVYPKLRGQFRVTISGAKESGEFVFKVTPKRLKLIESDNRGFVDVRLGDEIEVIRD